MSTSAEHLVAENAPVERRFYPRITPSVLIYVPFGQNNLGMLLNVSENGLMVSTPNGLDCNSAYRVSMRLNGLSSAIKVHVRTVWSTESKKRAGLQLLDLSDYDREQIRKWGALELERSQDKTGVHGEQSAPEADREPSPQEKPAEQPTFVTEPSSTKRSTTERPNELVPLSRPPAPPQALSPWFEDHAGQPEAERRLMNGFDVPSTAAAHTANARPAKTGRTHMRSAKSSLVAWGASIATLCLVAALVFGQDLFKKLLTHATHAATQSGVADGHSPSLASPNAAAAPALSNAPASNNAAKNRLAATAASQSRDSKSPRATSNLTPSTKRPAEISDTLDASDSGITDSDFGQLTANNAPPSSLEPTPTLSQLSANLPLANGPAPKILSSDASAGKSAITGSISGSNSARPNDLAASTPSDGASIPAPSPTLAPPPSVGHTSDADHRSDPAVIHMDVPENRIIDLHPPKGRSPSLVDLPGERVIKSASLTVHIQRSVVVSGEHWWWSWHSGKKKVVLGDLRSRVDPDASHVPTGAGTVSVRVTVDKDGNVTNLKPINGSITLVPSVARAIREWHYAPTTLDGKPVETQAYIRIDFHPAATRASRP
jgi:hypothetical protein